MQSEGRNRSRGRDPAYTSRDEATSLLHKGLNELSLARRLPQLVRQP